MLKLIKYQFCLLIFTSFLLGACGGKLPGADARKVSPNPKDRVKKNLEEGRGFRLMGDKKKGGSTNFEFASSNELWRASLDIIDFMPLATANYSGGIIVTDWYSEDQKDGESIKITIRFLSNEVRSDALNIKIFYKVCISSSDCKIEEREGDLKNQIAQAILKKAAIYEKQTKEKNFVPYKGKIRKD
tara:strand:- start:946 stop:1506 length:561 start_codon:yes stop_codon:yes gene_type:complete